MDELKIGFFKKIMYSVTSIKAYKSFAKLTVGKAILYLLFLSMILGAIAVIRPVYEYNSDIGKFINKVSKDCPEFTFTDGKLMVEGEMPLIYKDNNSIVIIDTSGASDENSISTYSKTYSDVVLITSDKLIVKSPQRYQVTDLNQLKGLTFTKGDVINLIPLLKLLGIFIYIFRFIYFIIAKGISALILSLFALVLNSVFKSGLKYGRLLGLSMYSLTLSIIIKAFLEILNISIPYFWVIYHVIALFYLILALNYINTDKKEMILD